MATIVEELYLPKKLNSNALMIQLLPCATTYLHLQQGIMPFISSRFRVIRSQCECCYKDDPGMDDITQGQERRNIGCPWKGDYGVKELTSPDMVSLEVKRGRTSDAFCFDLTVAVLRGCSGVFLNSICIFAPPPSLRPSNKAFCIGKHDECLGS